MATTEHDVAPDLDARYGRTRSSRRGKRWVALSVGAAFVAVFGAWILWAGVLGTPSRLEVDTTGHVVVDDSLVQVRYQLSVEPGTPVSCAAQVLNSGFSIVGWKIVEVPPSEKHTRTLGTEVRTTELGVTGLIYRCWLT